MTSVETGQMSGVETGLMSAAETGQMSSVARTGICVVSTHNDVSEVSTVPMLKSQQSPFSQCRDVQGVDRRCGPKTAKMTLSESRTVAKS